MIRLSTCFDIAGVIGLCCLVLVNFLLNEETVIAKVVGGC
jgi:hypothetical protein